MTLLSNISIHYCTRLVDADLMSATSVWEASSLFRGAIDAETVERLVDHHFKVKITDKGVVYFEDRNGKIVRLYIRVKPAHVKQGVQLAKAWRAEQRAKKEQLQQEIDMLMDGMTQEEILDRLRNGAG